MGKLENNELAMVDQKVFREHLDGLIVGQSNASQMTDTRNRYYQDLLGYTLVFPDDWEIESTTTTVIAKSPSLGSLRIEAQRLQNNIDPRSFIQNILGTENLLKSEGLSQFRLQGHTGITESNDLGLKERVAVIYLGPRAFIFRGEIPANADEEELDQMLLSSIRSFRAIQRGEVVAGGELKIKFVQATEFFDFSIVSQNSKIANFPEETLRLLNGYYPIGNPKEGEWIKLVE